MKELFLEHQNIIIVIAWLIVCFGIGINVISFVNADSRESRQSVTKGFAFTGFAVLAALYLTFVF